MTDINKPPAGCADVSWTVNVFDDEFDHGSPDLIDIARTAYNRIVEHDMMPVLTVRLPDGTTHEVDLQVEEDAGPTDDQGTPLTRRHA